MLPEFVWLAGVRFEVVEVEQPRDGPRKADAIADTDDVRVYVKRGLPADDFQRVLPHLQADVLILLAVSPAPSAV